MYMQQISQGRRLMLRLINHRLILHSREVIIVYYKAVDSYGNETIEEVTFTFIEEETQEVK